MLGYKSAIGLLRHDESEKVFSDSKMGIGSDLRA
jgi:hypothetical protein